MMSKKIVRYEHHGWDVAVYEEMMGNHRYHCLCWDCIRFHPKDRTKNCKIANILYNLNGLIGITTPVWECAEFSEFTPTE